MNDLEKRMDNISLKNNNSQNKNNSYNPNNSNNYNNLRNEVKFYLILESLL